MRPPCSWPSSVGHVHAVCPRIPTELRLVSFAGHGAVVGVLAILAVRGTTEAPGPTVLHAHTNTHKDAHAYACGQSCHYGTSQSQDPLNYLHCEVSMPLATGLAALKCRFSSRALNMHSVRTPAAHDHGQVARPEPRLVVEGGRVALVPVAAHEL